MLWVFPEDPRHWETSLNSNDHEISENYSIWDNNHKHKKVIPSGSVNPFIVDFLTILIKNQRFVFVCTKEI